MFFIESTDCWIQILGPLVLVTTVLQTVTKPLAAIFTLKSQHRTLDGHFCTLNCCKIILLG